MYNCPFSSKPAGQPNVTFDDSVSSVGQGRIDLSPAHLSNSNCPSLGPVSAAQQVPPGTSARINSVAIETIRSLGSILRDGYQFPKRRLLKYDGNPLEYYSFIKGFNETIAKKVSYLASQLHNLIDMCVGEAHESIKFCCVIDPPAAALAKAFDVLTNKRGKKYAAVTAHLDSITKGPPVTPEKETLSKLANDMTSCQITLNFKGLGLRRRVTRVKNVGFLIQRFTIISSAQTQWSRRYKYHWLLDYFQRDAGVCRRCCK